MCCAHARLFVGALCLLSLGVVIGACASYATTDKEAAKPMLLQIYFKVAKERAADFERMYAESYVPALKKQTGYLYSNLLRIFSEKVANEIEAATTEFNYQMELVFDTEANRRKWVASKEHAKAWPEASGMAENFAWRGFDLVGADRNGSE